jgi:hypothetical protein
MPRERHRVFRYKSSFRYAAPLWAFRFNPLRKLCFENNFGVSINKARNLKFEILVGGDTPTKGKIFNEPKCA